MGNARRNIVSQFRRDIVLVLILKAAGLYLLWLLFFSAPHQIHPTSRSTANQLLGVNLTSPSYNQNQRQVP